MVARCARWKSNITRALTDATARRFVERALASGYRNMQLPRADAYCGANRFFPFSRIERCLNWKSNLITRAMDTMNRVVCGGIVAVRSDTAVEGGAAMSSNSNPTVGTAGHTGFRTRATMVVKNDRLRLNQLPQAVLFDNDGIVLNSEPIIFEATAQVFAQYGIRLRRKDIQNGIGAGARYVTDPMQKYGLDDVSEDDLMHAREAAFRQLAVGRLQPFPDFMPFAHFLRRHGIRTALASSASTEVIMHNLGLAGVQPSLFDAIVNSSKIHRKKPAPDIFLEGAANLGVSPARCLVIEDSPPGIAAAKNAGMPVIAVATSFRRGRLHEADIVVRSLEHIHRGFADLLGVAMEE